MCLQRMKIIYKTQFERKSQWFLIEITSLSNFSLSNSKHIWSFKDRKSKRFEILMFILLFTVIKNDKKKHNYRIKNSLLIFFLVFAVQVHQYDIVHLCGCNRNWCVVMCAIVPIQILFSTLSNFFCSRLLYPSWSPEFSPHFCSPLKYFA